MAEPEPKERKPDFELELQKLERLSEADLKLLLENSFDELIDIIELEDLLSLLFSKKVISRRNRGSIKSKGPEHEKVEELLDILLTKGKEDIVQFFRCLCEKNQIHVLYAVTKNLGMITPSKSYDGTSKNMTPKNVLGKPLQKELKDLYLQEMAHIRCNPLRPYETQPIRKLFVNLSVVKEDVNHAAGKEKETKLLEHYWDIFSDQSENDKKKDIYRIVVQGKPGIGKTTLTKRLAVDWAEGTILSDKFDNVFVLTLSMIKPGQSLFEVILEQLVPDNSRLSTSTDDIKTYIEAHQEKCLFVFDGLDEMTQGICKEIDNMIQRKYLNKACLLLTSRPTENPILNTPSKIDQFTRIEGFTEENVKSFICKFFGESISGLNINKSTGCFEEIYKNRMVDIAKIPLILNILCLLYADHQAFPDNITKIYRELQELLCRRIKDETMINEAELKTILVKLGTIAYEGLLKENNQLLFSKKKIREEVGEDAFNAGLIWLENPKYSTSRNNQVYFLHKSFQEYAAAIYIASALDDTNMEPWEQLKTKIKNLGEQDLLLQFCAGSSDRLANEVLDFLDEESRKVISKDLLKILENLSQNKDLTLEDAGMLLRKDTFYQTTYKNMHTTDIRNYIELELKCLCSMEKQTENETHFVNQLLCYDYFKMEQVDKACKMGSLKFEKCIAVITNDEELQQLVTNAQSVSWIILKGSGIIKKFPFTERTKGLLEEICDKNSCELSICIGEHCIVTSSVLNLLKEHERIKYTQITLDNSDSFYNCDPPQPSTREVNWMEACLTLLGMRCLISLHVNLKVPDIIFATIGKILNQNADNLLEFNMTMHGAFILESICKELEKNLLLTTLKFVNILDQEHVSNFLQRCKYIRHLEIKDCTLDISSDILNLKILRELLIDNYRGVKQVGLLKNLHEFESLEKFTCVSVNDRDIKAMTCKKLERLRVLDISSSEIGTEGIRNLCENYEMLPELIELKLHDLSSGNLCENFEMLPESLELKLLDLLSGNLCENDEKLFELIELNLPDLSSGNLCENYEMLPELVEPKLHDLSSGNDMWLTLQPYLQWFKKLKRLDIVICSKTLESQIRDECERYNIDLSVFFTTSDLHPNEFSYSTLI